VTASASENRPQIQDTTARGQIVYITERAAAAKAGHDDAAELLEDLADRAAVLASRAEPGPGIPWEQVKAEAGL
jgi:hypothetical protein